jgi:hypothetical protein
VPEQRLISPEIRRWRRWSCKTLFQKTPIDLGFGVGRLYIGGETASEVDQGAHTTLSRGQGGHASPRCGCSLAPLRFSFGLRPGKIGGSGFVSSNSDNISCVTFSKHKNSRNRELALWHLVNRLVPKNA